MSTSGPQKPKDPVDENTARKVSVARERAKAMMQSSPAALPTQPPQVSAEEKARIKRSEKIVHALAEMITSEGVYLAGLKLLADNKTNILAAIKDNKQLTKAQKNTLTTLVETSARINEINSKLSEDFVKLKEAMLAPTPSPQNIDSIISRIQTNFAQTAYLHNKNMLAFLESGTIPKIPAIDSMQLGGRSFSNLISTPMQRFPRYSMLLEAVAANTEPTHPAHKGIQALIEDVKKHTVKFDESLGNPEKAKREMTESEKKQNKFKERNNSADSSSVRRQDSILKQFSGNFTNKKGFGETWQTYAVSQLEKKENFSPEDVTLLTLIKASLDQTVAVFPKKNIGILNTKVIGEFNDQFNRILSSKMQEAGFGDEKYNKALMGQVVIDHIMAGKPAKALPQLLSQPSESQVRKDSKRTPG